MGSKISTVVSCTLFGFITSFKQAVFLRIFEGVTNGNVAVVRTMVSEVVPEKRLVFHPDQQNYYFEPSKINIRRSSAYL